ncbi:MAG: response regulator transcription factor [Chloroflexi bacterium]|nr:response regulator transcription factor [Chloroflexota bacterium]
MLTSHSDDETVFAAITAGASGYLLKTATRREFLRAVRSVAEGKCYLDPVVTPGVLHRFKTLEAIGEAHDACGSAITERQAYALLSKREREVYSLIKEGCTNRDIAEQLVISEHTARNHVSHVLRKLNVNSRSQLAVSVQGSVEAS